jgi:branched-chain amino acid transport system ATP-binding protein
LSLLHVEKLQAGYGSAKVLFDICLSVKAGEAVSLMGRNGMGKTTTVKTIMGLIKPFDGRITFKGTDITSAAPYRIAQAGIGLVPEGRQIFPTLTVEENLRAIAISRGKWTLKLVYDFFPRLLERSSYLGSQLSGGEQQMLAIGRALMTNPSLIILDEATEGLAPLISAEIWVKLAELKGEGEAILVIDKNIGALSKLVDHHTILEKGRVVWVGSDFDLHADSNIVDRFLHL